MIVAGVYKSCLYVHPPVQCHDQSLGRGMNTRICGLIVILLLSANTNGKVQGDRVRPQVLSNYIRSFV